MFDQNNLQIRTSVILRQEFVNNFATLTQAPIILPLRHGRKQMHRYVTVIDMYLDWIAHLYHWQLKPEVRLFSDGRHV